MMSSRWSHTSFLSAGNNMSRIMSPPLCSTTAYYGCRVECRDTETVKQSMNVMDSAAGHSREMAEKVLEQQPCTLLSSLLLN
jgi:hypothetical protein